jgi:hypothetical protein
MKANITTPHHIYLAAQALKTRRYGYTYVHAGHRQSCNHGDIRFVVSGFGRSLQAGGHKYKVHAHRDGKPIPTTELQTLIGTR